ncbi:S-phase kinase-associated protein 2-like [Tropilaelaps mercedesae]|uniref:S-phase kinase-associated protein 2-like n=1 Tax=Tropilaelaps mercedesae TaxID=418985 RepID=A0A1V9XY59_9ACAR|nr:S-phase kinase-associated protein 2-like [Tropilaelaps mercedesae]
MSILQRSAVPLRCSRGRESQDWRQPISIVVATSCLRDFNWPLGVDALVRTPSRVWSTGVESRCLRGTWTSSAPEVQRRVTEDIGKLPEMMLALRRKRDLGWSDLYCEHQELTSPVLDAPSPPPRRRSRCILYGGIGPTEGVLSPPARENLFNRVPDEILKQIFSNLPKRDLLSCMSLCRRFYRVGSDRDLWHSADYFGLKFIDDSLVYEVLRGARMLRAANASSRIPLQEPINLQPLRLQFVDLTNTAISKPLLLSLLNASQDLRKLSLESLTYCDDDICASIGRNERLDTLNLCMVTGLTTTGVTHIMKVRMRANRTPSMAQHLEGISHPDLKELVYEKATFYQNIRKVVNGSFFLLELQNCQGLISLNVAWTPMDANCLMTLVRLLPRNLKELNIAGYTDRFTDVHLTALCNRCPKLERLCVADNSKLSPGAIVDIVSSLKELQHLDLSRCHRLHPEDMWALENLPKLEFLSCHSFPDWEDYEREIRKGLYRVAVNVGPDLFHIARPQPNQSRLDRVLWGVPMR